MALFEGDLRGRADEVVSRYPDSRSALLPLLYLAQAEEGLVTREAMVEVAQLLGLQTAEVEAVATFYTMFKRSPTGKWLVSVCTNVSCALAGGRGVFERIREELGEGAGGVTPDGEFTVEEVECLGACDAAPVVQVNYCSYDRVTEEQAVELIEKLRSGEAPPPSRGPRPVSHDETALILAGLGVPGDGGSTGSKGSADG